MLTKRSRRPAYFAEEIISHFRAATESRAESALSNRHAAGPRTEVHCERCIESRVILHPRVHLRHSEGAREVKLHSSNEYCPRYRAELKSLLRPFCARTSAIRKSNFTRTTYTAFFFFFSYNTRDGEIFCENFCSLAKGTRVGSFLFLFFEKDGRSTTRVHQKSCLTSCLPVFTLYLCNFAQSVT